jgi:hypothetical protein
MTEVQLPEMEVELVAFTRAALGIGIGLLAAHYLSTRHRQLFGWALVALGGLSTFPLRSDVLSRRINDQQPGPNLVPASTLPKGA